MKSYRAILGIFAIILIIAGGYAYADAHKPDCKGDHKEECENNRNRKPGHKGMRGDMDPMDFFMIERHKKNLELTEEQLTKIKSLRDTVKDTVQPFMEEMKKFNQEIREELKKEKMDKARIEELKKSIKDIQSKMLDQRIDHIISLKEILSPEQLQKLEELRENMRMHERKRMETEQCDTHTGREMKNRGRK